jgi:hypothetical protein
MKQNTKNQILIPIINERNVLKPGINTNKNSTFHQDV